MNIQEEKKSLLGDDYLISNDQIDSSTEPLDSTTTTATTDGPARAAFGFADIPFAVWLIILVELVERFAFYSLRSMLVLFFKEALGFDEDPAKALYSYFSSMSYFMPLIGSLLADSILGRFWCISVCTLIYACGSYVLVYAANHESRFFTYIALAFIGFGTGAIKPNVNTFGATSLRTNNPQALATYFSLFYASINVGSVIATIFIPAVREKWGFATAFLFPSVALTIVVVTFCAGYKLYVHVPPSSSLYKRICDLIYGAYRGKLYFEQSGIDPLIVEKIRSTKRFRANNFTSTDEQEIAARQAAEELESFEQANPDVVIHDNSSLGFLDNAKQYYRPEHVEQLRRVTRVLPVFPFIIAFFLCFNQTSSTFLLQATHMNRDINIGKFHYKILAPQVTALNALSILTLVPLFDRIIYPWLRRTFNLQLKHLNRVLFGLILTAISFGCSAFLEYKIENSPPHSIHIAWQIPQYLLISLAELFISACGLEFVYSQAPKAFKSTLSSFWSLCSALGDLIAGLLFTFLHLPHKWQFSLLCSGFVVVNFFAFLPVVMSFNKRSKKFYDLAHQEFTNPGSVPAAPPEPEYPFRPLTWEEQEEMAKA